MSQSRFEVPRWALNAHLSHGRGTYQTAAPFPHVVLDEFLPGRLADSLEAAFPGGDEEFWFRHTDVIDGRARTEKLACNDLSVMPQAIRGALEYFNSPGFLAFLSKLTGISGLIADPDYLGGGMHLIRPGGFLDIHADFNIHPRTQLDRRLNLLLYLNRDWKDEYGGTLELWDRDMVKCVRSVTPILNRCVVFSTTSTSYHGHPHKVACPPRMSRKSLALYYYTDGRPDSERREAHLTLYRDAKRADDRKKTGLLGLLRRFSQAE